MKSVNGRVALGVNLTGQTGSETIREADLNSRTTHGGDHPAKQVSRVVSMRLEPTPEQWQRLRDLAWMAMRFRNRLMRAKYVEMMGYKLPDPIQRTANKGKRKGETVDETISQREYKDHDELSGAVYPALLREIDGAWKRDCKRIMAGAPFPQWREADSLSVGGVGVKIKCLDGDYFADLALQSNACEGGCWIRYRIRSAQDAYHGDLLASMARGETKIDKAVINIRKQRGKVVLRIAFKKDIVIPPMGKRTATLAMDHDRLLLRTETETVDHTHRLMTIHRMKDDWDGFRRRCSSRIGRKKGGSRAKRRAFAKMDFDAWCKEYEHSWSREIIDWCVKAGVGFMVVDLPGGDFAAYRLKLFLAYKGEEEGITMKEADIADASTDRSVTAPVKKRQKKARKLQDSLREINHQLGGSEHGSGIGI